MDIIVLASIPLFILLIGLEAWHSHRHNLSLYADKRDMIASLAMGSGNVIITALTKGLALAVWFLAYEYRLFDWDFTQYLWLWPLLIVLEDLCYYGFHRASHRVHIFWTSHVNHHSSQKYNLSTALRQEWTALWFNYLFWVPLALLGVHPLMIITAQAVSLIYQFWVHTQAINKLPRWFEYVFNTPSHHRVHHGSNPQYLDKNYGGILIIWDRLFGTFEPEQETVTYGLTKNIHTYNPLKIAFHGWAELFHQLRHAPNLSTKWQVLSKPPGWYRVDQETD